MQVQERGIDAGFYELIVSVSYSNVNYETVIVAMRRKESKLSISVEVNVSKMVLIGA